MPLPENDPMMIAQAAANAARQTIPVQSAIEAEYRAAAHRLSRESQSHALIRQQRSQEFPSSSVTDLCRPESLADVLAESDAAIALRERFEAELADAEKALTAATAKHVEQNEAYVRGEVAKAPSWTPVERAEREVKDANVRANEARRIAARKGELARTRVDAERDAWYAEVLDLADERRQEALQALTEAQKAVSAYYQACQTAGSLQGYQVVPTPDLSQLVPANLVHPRVNVGSRGGVVPVTLQTYREVAGPEKTASLGDLKPGPNGLWVNQRSTDPLGSLPIGHPAIRAQREAQERMRENAEPRAETDSEYWEREASRGR